MWYQLNNKCTILLLLTTQTAEYAHEKETLSEMTLVQYLRHFLYCFLSSLPLVVSEGRGLYIDVPSEEILFFICFVQEKLPIFISIWVFFLSVYSSKHDSSLHDSVSHWSCTLTSLHESHSDIPAFSVVGTFLLFYNMYCLVLLYLWSRVKYSNTCNTLLILPF